VSRPSSDAALAVVVGSGSAGRRHASMLRRLEPEMEVVVVRRNGAAPLPEDLARLDVQVEVEIGAAIARRAAVAVVASPATCHAADAIQLLDAGAHVLTEKPLAATTVDAASIADAARRSGRELVVGYHLRFGRVAPLVAGAVRSGVLGRPSSFRFEVGQHLADWRPGTDPRQSVSARAELGGGVLLELSHELDAVRFIIGDIAEVDARLSTEGAPTDGKVDTVADLTVTTADDVPGEVHLDMTSQTPFRRWTVTGPGGSLHADLLSGRVELQRTGRETEVLRSSAPGERDLAEERLVRHLFDVARGEPSLCTAADGIAAVAVVEAARTSAARQRPVPVLAHDHT
jgi:predicted dehydrogenase